MTLPDIRALLPQTGDMVLLDSVVAADADSLCAELAIRADSQFFDGHGVPAWIGVEYMAQAVAAHAGYAAHLCGAAPRVGFLLGSRRYQAHRPHFALGSVLHVQVRRTLQGENGFVAFDCRIDLQGDGGATTLASAAINVFVPADVNEFLHTNG